MPTIEFPATCAYLAVPPLGRVPAIEVELIYGSRNTRVVGLLDSGSAVTVFSREVAGLLGIEDVSVGDPSVVRTLGGPLPFFIFDMEMAVHLPGLTGRFPGRIGFFLSATGRNILGKNLIFSHFEIAFRERTQELKFRPEETEGALWTS
jgi:hypothetical protein